MEVKEFQEKLAALCEEALANGRKLTGTQVKEFFSSLELDKEKLILVFRYLKSQGIQIEGLEGETETLALDRGEVAVENPDSNSEEGTKENPCLTEEDQEYLAGYLEELRKMGPGEEKIRTFMIMVAKDAADMKKDGMILADLIQEANLALLTLLSEMQQEISDDEMKKLLKQMVKQAVDAADEQNFEDDCLVAKVQNLDSVMKELTDGEEGEPKFSVEELAIMLDMDIDEMKDIIRLTGEY